MPSNGDVGHTKWSQSPTFFVPVRARERLVPPPKVHIAGQPAARKAPSGMPPLAPVFLVLGLRTWAPRGGSEAKILPPRGLVPRSPDCTSVARPERRTRKQLFSPKTSCVPRTEPPHRHDPVRSQQHAALTTSLIRGVPTQSMESTGTEGRGARRRAPARYLTGPCYIVRRCPAALRPSETG